MGTIYANDPDHHGSAYFDVMNLRSSGEYKVVATEQSLMYTVSYFLLSLNMSILSTQKNNKRRLCTGSLYCTTFSRSRLDLFDLLDFTKTFISHSFLHFFICLFFCLVSFCRRSLNVIFIVSDSLHLIDMKDIYLPLEIPYIKETF